MKPIEFYQLGTTAASNATSEAEQRMAVGRIYYGLHHEACCRFFRQNPNALSLSRSSRHTELCRRFNTLTDTTPKTVGNLLNDLRELRTQADYELTKIQFRQQPMTIQQLVRTTVTLGKQLLQELEQYSPGQAQDGCNCPSN